MKRIKLTQGKFAIVDDADFDWLNEFNWYVSGNGYATRTSKHIRMHRVINQTPDGLDTDHINGDKLDNRRKNLRSVTRSINNFNSSPPIHNKSGKKGVWFDQKNNRWYAQITVNNKRICLGSSRLKSEAIDMRSKAESRYICA